MEDREDEREGGGGKLIIIPTGGQIDSNKIKQKIGF